MGLLGLMLCDLWSSWRGIKTAKRDLVTDVTMAILLLVIGFTPYVDNWGHLGGFVMGVLFGLMLLPNFRFKGCSLVVRGIFALLAFPLMATIFMLCLVILLRKVGAANRWCRGCEKFNTYCMFRWCEKDLA
jgi:hypothetical protein